MTGRDTSTFRCGYINDDTDDILQLTVQIPATSNDRIYGRSRDSILLDSTGRIRAARHTVAVDDDRRALLFRPYPPPEILTPPLVAAPQAGFYYPDQLGIRRFRCHPQRNR